MNHKTDLRIPARFFSAFLHIIGAFFEFIPTVTLLFIKFRFTNRTQGCIIYSLFYTPKETHMSDTKKKHTQPSYTVGEEIANSITHGAAALLAIAGTVLLILRSGSDPWKIVGCSVYGFSMIMLFTMSCLYHAISAPRGKKVMRVFDHTSIYLLIAGTYTPITLVTMRGAIGWTLFGIVWAACILGIVLNAISIERFRKFSMWCYIASGWSVVIAAVPVIQKVPLPGLLLLLAGGIAYTLGVLFYRKKTVRYFHTIWHMFVVAGAVLQFFSIYFYVI